jgi:hypothetical protein
LGLPDIPPTIYAKERMKKFRQRDINYVYARQIAQREAVERTDGRIPDTLSSWAKLKIKDFLRLGINRLVAERLVEVEEKKRKSDSAKGHPNQTDRQQYRVPAKVIRELEEWYEGLLSTSESESKAAEFIDKTVFEKLQKQGKVPDDYIPSYSSGSSRSPPRKSRSSSPLRRSSSKKTYGS